MIANLPGWVGHLTSRRSSQEACVRAEAAPPVDLLDRDR